MLNLLRMPPPLLLRICELKLQIKVAVMMMGTATLSTIHSVIGGVPTWRAPLWKRDLGLLRLHPGNTFECESWPGYVVCVASL